MDLSIIIPAYNEEKNILRIFNRLWGVLKKLNLSFEVIFIDDGSTDRTFDIINGICTGNKSVKCISFLRNFKKSAAYMAGFDLCTGRTVITMDADLQDDPKEIPRLIEALDKYDLVIGWKYQRRDPFFKRAPSKIFNLVNHRLFGLKLHDYDSGFRAMKNEVAKKLGIYGDLYRYIPAIVSSLGYKVGEIKVEHHERRYGKSKYGIRRLITGPLDLLTVKFLTQFNQRPLHLFGTLGIISFFIGFLAGLVVLFFKFFLNHSFSEHLALLMFGVLLMILGVQLTGIGLLGELIISKKMDAKNYRIRERLN